MSATLADAVDRAIDPAYLAASGAMVRYVRASVAGVLEAVGGGDPADERLPEAIGVVPEARIAFAWLLAESARARAADRARAARDLDAHAAIAGGSRPLIDHVARHYPDVLLGRRSAPSILLKPPGLDLWEGYFSARNGLYDVHNALAATGLEHVWPDLGEAPRILELGAGTGGATAAMVAALDRLGGDAGSLTISDAAPLLLLRAAERLGRNIRRLRLDFTRPFDDQGIAPGSVDVIVAVNALHAAPDLAATLGHCGRALAPGGALVLSESICGAGASVHQEFVFNLLPRAASGARDTGSRFLTGERWRAMLASHGFAGSVAVNRLGPELALLAVVRPAA